MVSASSTPDAPPPAPGGRGTARPPSPRASPATPGTAGTRWGGERDLRHQVVRPGQGQVAGEHRRRVPERLGAARHALRPVHPGQVHVHRGRPAPQMGPVHHVVVHERARLDQLERHARPQQRSCVARAAPGPPAAPGERRAQALPAAPGERGDAARHVTGEHGVEVVRLRHPLVQHLAQDPPQGPGGGVGGERSTGPFRRFLRRRPQFTHAQPLHVVRTLALTTWYPGRA